MEKRHSDLRLYFLFAVFGFFGILIILRLFVLMILEREFYTELAAGAHEVSSQLFPERGDIFVQDFRTGEQYPVAINRDSFLLFADTREINDDKTAEDAAAKLSEVFGYDDKKKISLYAKLNKRIDPYEPIQEKVDEASVERIKSMNIPGIQFVRKSDRFYPEGALAAHVVGFLGKNESGQSVGRYGIEGYWDNDLKGTGGFLERFQSASGGWIPLAGRTFRKAQNGVDIVLTIDRSLEHYGCERLRSGMKEYEATSASLVIMEPSTGAIRAICSMPDFDPNAYNLVENASAYNNTAIFTPYEPGSIFKPITMAAALDAGVVAPETTFVDTGSRDGICKTPIKNAGGKSYGLQTMTEVLQNSVNTGMVFVVEHFGKKLFREAVERFGFGVKDGVELDTEAEGTISSLSKNSDERGIDCYAATASFGQGIAVTPIQIAAAFSALANGGMLMKPFVVEEIRHSDGRVERTRPKEIRQAVSSRAASLVTGMLTQVVEHGYGGRAKVNGYYVGGKSGTAQISGLGGYTEDTNHSFVGFAPLDNPKFVIVVKFEKPKRTYAEVTAAPVFSDIAKFALQYYEVPPTR